MLNINSADCQAALNAVTAAETATDSCRIATINGSPEKRMRYIQITEQPAAASDVIIGPGDDLFIGETCSSVIFRETTV